MHKKYVLAWFLSGAATNQERPLLAWVRYSVWKNQMYLSVMRVQSSVNIKAIKVRSRNTSIGIKINIVKSHWSLVIMEKMQLCDVKVHIKRRFDFLWMMQPSFPFLIFGPYQYLTIQGLFKVQFYVNCSLKSEIFRCKTMHAYSFCALLRTSFSA